MKVAVVIPCYCVVDSVLPVLQEIPALVETVICVDDACPQNSGQFINSHSHDPRVKVISHSRNMGVGGATITGYREALKLGAEIIVKLDGDGQMNPADIPSLIEPIISSKADYTKGNRFYLLANLQGMPFARLLGNAGLSFMSKFSTGYWRSFDPTNGFTAIHKNVLREINLAQLHQRYFFESDMLYQLATLRAVVQDVPQRAKYGDEVSHLNVARSIPLFLWLHKRNFLRRLFYNYFLRDFHLASIEWILGPILMVFGLIFGSYTWVTNVAAEVETPTGTVMVAALSIIIGLQLLLSAIGFDIDNQPKTPIFPQLSRASEEG